MQAITDIFAFILIVGIGSTLVLDGWAVLLDKVAGLTPTNWGMVGRWLVGLSRGQAVLDGANTAEPSRSEKGLGWTFHYLVGLGYAALVVLLYGSTIVTAPHAGASSWLAW